MQGFRPARCRSASSTSASAAASCSRRPCSEAVPRLYGEAVEQAGVNPVAPPQVEVTDMRDNEVLAFTAEVDVRPEITLPGVRQPVGDRRRRSRSPTPTSTSSSRTCAAASPASSPVERAAQDGDFLTLDLVATVDGDEVPGGTATGLSYELGSGQLLQGIDEALAGVTAGEARTFSTPLVAGELAGQTAEVAVTVQAVNERELPELDDAWAGDVAGFGSAAELREDVRSRIDKAKHLQQGVQARDKVLEALLATVDVPLPESVVEAEVQWRRRATDEQLTRGGLTMEGYLENEGKTAEEFETELTTGASEAVKAQLVLDAVADAEQLGVTDAELSDQVVRRAQRAGVSPDQYAQQVVAGRAAADARAGGPARQGAGDRHGGGDDRRRGGHAGRPRGAQRRGRPAAAPTSRPTRTAAASTCTPTARCTTSTRSSGSTRPRLRCQRNGPRAGLPCRRAALGSVQAHEGPPDGPRAEPGSEPAGPPRACTALHHPYVRRAEAGLL